MGDVENGFPPERSRPPPPGFTFISIFCLPVFTTVVSSFAERQPASSTSSTVIAMFILFFIFILLIALVAVAGAVEN